MGDYTRRITPDEIRECRKAQGRTQGAMAELLGVSIETVSSWEQGRRRPCCTWIVRAIRAGVRPFDHCEAGTGR